jgi:hypothetical protein
MGLSKKEFSFLSTSDSVCKVISVLNWFLHSNLNNIKLKYDKLEYKKFRNKKILRSIPRGTNCVVILPGLRSSLKKMALKLRTPYVVFVGNPLVHRGRKVAQRSLPHHITLMSHLYFFYKKGLDLFISIKVYRLIALRLKQ